MYTVHRKDDELRVAIRAGTTGPAGDREREHHGTEVAAEWSRAAAAAARGAPAAAGPRGDLEGHEVPAARDVVLEGRLCVGLVREPVGVQPVGEGGDARGLQERPVEDADLAAFDDGRSAVVAVVPPAPRRSRSCRYPRVRARLLGDDGGSSERAQVPVEVGGAESRVLGETLGTGRIRPNESDAPQKRGLKT